MKLTTLIALCGLATAADIALDGSCTATTLAAGDVCADAHSCAGQMLATDMGLADYNEKVLGGVDPIEEGALEAAITDKNTAAKGAATCRPIAECGTAVTDKAWLTVTCGADGGWDGTGDRPTAGAGGDGDGEKKSAKALAASLIASIALVSAM